MLRSDSESISDSNESTPLTLSSNLVNFHDHPSSFQPFIKFQSVHESTKDQLLNSIRDTLKSRKIEPLTTRYHGRPIDIVLAGERLSWFGSPQRKITMAILILFLIVIDYFVSYLFIGQNGSPLISYLIILTVTELLVIICFIRWKRFQMCYPSDYERKQDLKLLEIESQVMDSIRIEGYQIEISNTSYKISKNNF